MEFIREEQFELDGKTFDIRLVKNIGDFIVRAFYDNRPASHMYSVEEMTRVGFTKQFGYDPIIDLFESVKEEIVNGTWEKYLALSVGSREEIKDEN